jgi:microcystin-dependent protein
MACSNCFNGCTDITSDQCVRYTGIDIPGLGIVTGDSLASVELQISTYILSIISGVGILPTIDPDDLCALVSLFLPESGDITLNDVISALIQSICNQKIIVDSLITTINILNADYDIACLQGVTVSSDTHDILQAAITKLCATDTALAAFILDVTTNYVQLADLNNLIQSYLDSISTANLQKTKMVPYVAYEYYGSLDNFSISGEGTGEFIDVNLCNGQNGTPDKRGRVAVGVTNGVGGAAMSITVDPSVLGNPTYLINTLQGSNTITLTNNQIPLHDHEAIATSTAEPHSHFIAKVGPNSGSLSTTQPLDTKYDVSGFLGPERFSYDLQSTSGTANVGPTNPQTVSVSTSVTVSETGGGLGHSNIQPSIGAYFIMYIP